MIDPTPNEQNAMTHAGQMGGEYLDSIARSDLASLSPEEWRTFIEAVITGYCDHLRDLAARDEERLAAMQERVPF